MNKPCKHAALIKAWADGATIQVLQREGVWITLEGPGGDPQPLWGDEFEYRVKPVNVMRYFGVFPHYQTRELFVDGGYGHCDEVPGRYNGNAPVGILRIEINPNTLELVTAVMEKP